MNLVLWLLISGAARAEVGIDGGSGGITAPTTEMLPPGKMGFALGMTSEFSSAGQQVGGLPFGAGFSFNRSTELGLHVATQPRSSADPTFWGTLVGLSIRRRLLGHDEVSVPLVMQADVTGITGEWSGQVTAVSGFKLGRVGVYPALGLGWRERDGYDAAASVAVARYLHPRVRMLGEVNARVGFEGLQGADARLGLRFVAYRRAHLITWLGGGVAAGELWGGGGVTLVLYAEDPLEVDRDGDEISDWQDTCPHQAEDVDRFQDHDGCPDLDNDGDGIPDALDDTPDGETLTSLQYPTETPQLRMRIHERSFPGEDADAP